MKKLSMARARQLIERELGIKVKELAMPENYNGNPDLPWFDLKMGNQTITVTYAGAGNFSKGNELINLTVTHENSSAYVSEYFYADTMEFCAECTEKAKYEVLCDRMGITETDAKLKRLNYEASDAVFRHYHFLEPIKSVEQTETKTQAAPDQPKEGDVLADAPEEALDEYPMPDPNLTVADLEACGYLYGDLLPLSKDQALSLFKEDLAVFTIKDGDAKMAFIPDEIQEHTGMFAVRRDGWEEGREFSAAIEDRMKHQEQREAAFLQSPQDAFAIYQVKGGDELRDIRFEPLDWLESKGISVSHGNYDLAYTALLTDKGSTHDRLEALWDRFNNDFPHDFVRPSPSVSDVIALKQNGVVSFHYVDSFGFKEIPGFLKEADIPAPSNILHDIHSESTTINSTLDSFEGKLLQGHNKFRLMAFDLGGKYLTKSCYEFDIGESELEWWCRKVKNNILSRKDKAAGFTVHVWNEETREWNAYTPDGKHTMTFDTGRRLDGIHESLHQEINFPIGPESNEISDVEQEEMEEGPELEM